MTNSGLFYCIWNDFNWHRLESVDWLWKKIWHRFYWGKVFFLLGILVEFFLYSLTLGWPTGSLKFRKLILGVFFHLKSNKTIRGDVNVIFDPTRFVCVRYCTMYCRKNNQFFRITEKQHLAYRHYTRPSLHPDAFAYGARI